MIDALHPGTTYRQCTRCREWKHVSQFHTGMAMESERVCKPCFPIWLEEEWEKEKNLLGSR